MGEFVTSWGRESNQNAFYKEISFSVEKGEAREMEIKLEESMGSSFINIERY